MRLTLRTLLAYLDNTLDPQDAEVLRVKLSESSFATQLAQRIRAALVDGSLGSPSPDAVGPIEDANAMSEYLDSTLTPAQIAEIERACLESSPHLAEAAACHQILTIVMGKAAEVSPDLRQRIYELPERRIEDMVTGGSFAAVSVPTEQPLFESLADHVPTVDVNPEASELVRPVGVADSGVSDAPTRLRQSSAVVDPSDRPQRSTLAGSRLKSVSDSQIYGGSIRPSRITPWLVSLAVAAVLLFVLTQIFQPLLNSGTNVAGIPNIGGTDVENTDTDRSDENAVEIEVSAENAPPMVVVEPDPSGSLPAEELQRPVAESPANELPANELPANELPANESVQLLPPPEPIEETIVDLAATASAPGLQAEPTEDELMTPPDPAQIGEAMMEDADAAQADASAAESVTIESVPATSDPTTAVDESLAEMETSDSAPPLPPITTTASVENPTSVSDADVSSNAKQDPDPNAIQRTVAKITSSDTLICAFVDGQWVRLKGRRDVATDTTLVCGPTFRAEMETDFGVRVTLVGPAQVEWTHRDDGELELQVLYGNLLLTALESDAKFNLRLADHPVALDLGDQQTTVAASVTHYRAPGLDPLKPSSRVPISGILSVQGTVGLKSESGVETLETGVQWVKRNAADAEVSEIESVPEWIDPPDDAVQSLEAEARESLLALIKGGDSLEMALQESMMFRRSEVAALAARTLLGLGRADVYFGGDGILSQPKQRAYWPDHFRSLRHTIDRSPELAAAVQEAINKMDSGNATTLFRLLTGYSEEQLKGGGDLELVEWLDAPSMAVRVLAIENLHEITGTTLYFRAEQENAKRRAQTIKKWSNRQRKGDIR